MPVINGTRSLAICTKQKNKKRQNRLKKTIMFMRNYRFYKVDSSGQGFVNHWTYKQALCPKVELYV